MKKIIIIVLSLSIIFGFLFWRFGPNFSSQNKSSGPVTLTFWGLWEDEGLIKPVITRFQQLYPNVTVSYVRQSSLNYRTRVQTQIREGVGPDVFMIHNSWMTMFDGDLYPAPASVYSLTDYRNLYYPISEKAFVKDNQIYGASFGMDGIAMYVNEDILQGIGGKVPTNWQEFIDVATRATVRDQSGEIRTAGAAIGATGNVDHWSDILGLLLLQQPGVNFDNVASPQVAEVFRFYTGFVTDPSKKVWDVTMPSSTQAFAEGRVLFYFAPSWRAHELRQLNPNLKFKVVNVPRLTGRQIAWASFWGQAVSAKTKYPQEAWEFIKFLSSEESEKQMYIQASQTRLFGEPYSLRSLTPEIKDDPLVGAFVNQGPYYGFWYLSSNTYDSGINDEMIKYFEDGINATLQGTDPQVALQTVNSGVQQVMQKYIAPPPVSQPSQ